MNRFLLAGLLLIAAGSTFAAHAADMSGRAGNYVVVVAMRPDPPTEGRNTAVIRLMDPGGRTVTNAGVSVRYFMPSLPGRPPMMDYTVPATATDSQYEASIGISMAGNWMLEITVTREGKSEVVRFGFIVK